MESTTGPPSSGAPGAIRTRNKPHTNITKRACDQCKFRKIKCSLSQPCKACQSMGFDCTFLQPQKKRGPTGHRVSQIRQQQTHLVPNTPQDNQISKPDAFQYHVPATSVDPGQPISLPGSSWSTPDVPIPVNGATGLAPSPVVDAWGSENTSLDSHGSSVVGWNDHQDVEYWLPDNLGAQVPVFEFPGSNIYLKPSLPSIIQPVSDVPAMNIHPHEHQNIYSPAVGSVGSLPSDNHEGGDFWPASINEANMIPWIDVYFDRLHPTVPVLSRASLFTRMMSQEHRKNSQFGAMTLSLCAFSLTQPIEINERPTSSRATQARLMMHEATKMRSCSDFGEHPTIEAVLTSFFLFGCLFGSNQHNAAWLRMREALDLASTLGLNDPNSYRDLPGEEKGQRLRTYLVLSITERAYALQKLHPVIFSGKPGFSMRSVHEFLHNATHSLVSGIIVHNEKDAEGMMGLARMMELFDAIDEDFINCWNRRCEINTGFCQKFTESKALSMHESLARVSQAERYKGYDWFERAKGNDNDSNALLAIGLRETQAADIFITQKWIHNRVWLLCLNHGLLRANPERPEMSFSYSVTIAESALQTCRSLRLSSMEAHGIGLTEKLYDIAVGATDILCNISPPYGTGMTPLGAYPESISPTTTPQSLAEDFLLLMRSFRGGNHPFLEKYQAHLHSLHIPTGKASGWAQH
ncbi:Transcription factorfungi [Penicillium lividum]|nr:Transcription factorfungi [Penicillium lividum]